MRTYRRTQGDEMIFAFLACTRIQWEDGCEEPVEEHGWVDERWSMRVLHDSRNDVGPVLAAYADEYDFEDEVLRALSLLPGGFMDKGDGTFYSADSDCPWDDPWRYSYALHFTRKTYGALGWQEKPWHPVKDGGIDLGKA